MPSGGGGNGAAPIFISYRRDDAAGHARLLFEKLSGWFGADRVFFDQDALQAGDPFPQRLDGAVRAASVTLAVIAKDWLSILNQRAGQPGVDVVHEELRLALELQGEDGSRLVVPVLMGGAQMFAAHDLVESVRNDLARLCGLDAIDLGGKQARWEHDVHRLVVRIRERIGLRPVAKLSEADRLAKTKATLSSWLADDDLKPLREVWGAAPPLESASDAIERVLTYTDAIGQALAGWRKLGLSADRQSEVKLRCQKILALLYGLAVDPAEARLWLNAEASVVPVTSAGTLAVAYATQEGHEMAIAPLPSAVDDFRSPGTADLNAPDRGVGLDDRSYAQQVLWEDAFRNPLKPYPTGQNALDDRNRQALKTRLGFLRKLRKADFLLTGIAPDTAPRSPVLEEIAAELDVVALLRTGCAGRLLTVDEAELNNLVALCLDTIETLR